MRRQQTLILFSAVIALLIGHSGATGQPGCGVHCGTERWTLKTLTDGAAATVVAATPQVISVTDLVHRHAPTTLPASNRVAPTENQQFTVTALLIGWKEESGPTGDHDFHLVLADPSDHTKTMIAEIPSPQCSGACASTQVGAFQAARQVLTSQLGSAPTTTSVTLLNPPRTVEVTGVGFFDFDHGQDGLAENCVEIHPVLRIAITGQAVGGAIQLPTGVTHTCGAQGRGRGGRGRGRGRGRGSLLNEASRRVVPPVASSKTDATVNIKRPGFRF